MNYDLFKDINNLAGNGFVDELMKLSAKYLIFVVFAILAVVCVLRLRQRLIWPVVSTVVALVVAFVAGRIESAVHSESRPFQTHHVHQLIAHANGQSFPSDHATAAFAVALACAVFLSLRIGVLLFVLALLIGFARVYDGIHYPLDIAGGFLAGLVGVLISYGLTRLARRRISSRAA